jgi:hypothetical protein
MPGKKGPGIHKLEKMADGTGEQAENAQKALENMGFRMQMGSKSATNSDSAFAMKDESNMYMSALFNAGHGGAPGHVHGGSTEFKIDDSGATLSNVDTKIEKIEQPKSSSANIKIDDQGEDAFYNNLISSSKDMNAMVSQGIDPKDRKAVLDYGNKKAASMNQSSGGGSSINVSVNKDEKKDANNIAAIESSGQREMDKFIGNINLQNYGTEMEAKRDSMSTHNQVKMNLIKGTTNRSPENLAAITKIAGYEGNKAANKVRISGNIPTVSNNTSRSANDSFVSKSNERTGNNVNISTSGPMPISGAVRGSGDVYRHPVFSVDKPVEYKRDGKLYIDSNSGPQMAMPDGALKYFNRNK